MAQIWLHSDWHWKHENLYHFTYVGADGTQHRVRERFLHASEGDAFMDQRYRELIRPQDHVWFLGDMTMFRGHHCMHEFIAFFKSLPGHKRLILGNHDHYNVGVYSEAGFEKVRASNVIDGLLLTHYPVHPSSLPMRGIGNVHGHTHQHPDEGPRYLNVSVERTGYEPVPIEECRATIQKKIADAQALVDVSGNMLTGE